MSCRCIINKAKFVLVVVVVTTALLAGYCQSMGPSQQRQIIGYQMSLMGTRIPIYADQGIQRSMMGTPIYVDQGTHAPSIGQAHMNRAIANGVTPEEAAIDGMYLDLKGKKQSSTLHGGFHEDMARTHEINEAYSKDKEGLKKAIPQQSANKMLTRESVNDGKNEGHSHSAAHNTKESDTAHIVEELLLKKLQLIKNNFEVQKEILVECETSADRLVAIFNTIEKEEVEVEVEKVKESRSSPLRRIVFQKKDREMKKAPQETRIMYHFDREQLLADVLSNLHSVVSSLPAALFNQFKLPVLSEWMNLSKNANQNEQPFELLSSKHVERIPDELYERILEPMTNSEHRIRWKRDIKELLDRNDISALKKLEKMKGGKRGGTIDDKNENEFAALKKLRELNAMRIYDESVNIRLHIIRAMFEAGMLAYDNKPDAAALLAEQQKMAKKLADAAKYMNSFAQGMGNMLVHLEKLLKNINEVKQKTQNELIYELASPYNSYDDDLKHLGLEGIFAKLDEYGPEALAELVKGKSEHYVSAMDGLEAVLKYELMLDAVEELKLRHDFVSMDKT